MKKKQLELSTSGILKTSEFLMSQFMLVVLKQFTITLEQRFQASTIIWQLTIENNHEPQIIANFVVII